MSRSKREPRTGHPLGRHRSSCGTGMCNGHFSSPVELDSPSFQLYYNTITLVHYNTDTIVTH